MLVHFSARCFQTKKYGHKLRDISISGQFTVKCSWCSCSTDGRNDSDSKLYPIVVRYQNSVTGLGDCTLLSLPNLELNATSEDMGGLTDIFS